MKQIKLEPANPFAFLWALSFAGKYAMTNLQRRELWAARYKTATGINPVAFFTVGFCITCNKPHWFTRARHKFIHARCKGC